MTDGRQTVKQHLSDAGFPVDDTDIARVAEAYALIGAIVDLLHGESADSDRSQSAEA